MTEKEKIIETLRASGYGYFVTHEEANADEALNDAADALIQNGIRDINAKGVVAVEGEVSIVPKNIIADVKFALDGNVAEWKRRAEVAEKKYNIALVGYAKCHRKITHYNKMTTTYDREITQQAEREIEEERK